MPAAAQESRHWGVAAGMSIVVGSPAPVVPDEPPLLAGGDRHGAALEAFYRLPLERWIDAEVTAVFSRITSGPSTWRSFRDEEYLYPAAEVDMTAGITLGPTLRARTPIGSTLIVTGVGASYNRLEKDADDLSEVRPFVRVGLGWEADLGRAGLRLSATFNNHIGGRGIAFVPLTAGVTF